MGDTVQAARAAFARQAWGDARELLAAADGLAAEDLHRLAVAAHLVGHQGESDRAWEQAHQAYLAEGDPEAAARCGFWLGLGLLLRGEEARGGGWLARAERVLDGVEGSCAARGMLLVPGFFAALGSDLDEAGRLCQRMVAIGRECGDADVVAFGLLGLGQTAVARGDPVQGVRFLDEVMVSVTTGEVSPIPAGIVYCAVLEACMEVYDVRRAVAWTDAFEVWCSSQPDLVPYRGQCLVHRSEVVMAHGGWAEAMDLVERARLALSEPPHPALGLALYQQGELHRLRGELAAADEAYRAAHQQGRAPVPGLALLRLAEGNRDAAATSIRRMADEVHHGLARPTILLAAVEVLLAVDDLEGARARSEELLALAEVNPVPLLQTAAAYATGAVRLAGGDAEGAVEALRRSVAGWVALDRAYEGARARVQLALALRALGDVDAARLERDSARATFERLGAAPDLARLAELEDRPAPASPQLLSEREQEVLRRVAAGLTNREIAAALTISEHTVARHLQNIFAKVGVSTRAAATAYAYEHGIV